MSYRDDLAAAQARAAAVERELSEAHEQQGEDGARLSQLERSLAAALSEIADLRESQPQKKAPAPAPAAAPRKSGNGSVAALVILAVTLSAGVCTALMRSDSDSYDEPYVDDYDYSYTYEQEDYVDLAGLFPSGFDPVPEPPVILDTIDVDEALEQAQSSAADHFGSEIASGPFLTGLRAEFVDDEGVADLEYGSVVYDFGVTHNPLPREERVAPLGAIRHAPQDSRSCAAVIYVHGTGMTAPEDIPDFLGGGNGPPCSEAFLDLQCSVAEVRKRAIKAGAPRQALAEVYASSCAHVDCREEDNRVCCTKSKSKGQKSYWEVEIVDSGETLFSKVFADNCPK